MQLLGKQHTFEEYFCSFPRDSISLTTGTEESREHKFKIFKSMFGLFLVIVYKGGGLLSPEICITNRLKFADVMSESFNESHYKLMN